MSLVVLKAKLLRWGNSFGLRLSRQDVERLRLRPGSDVEVRIHVARDTIEPAHARAFSLGGRAADEHDALFEGEAVRDQQGSNP